MNEISRIQSALRPHLSWHGARLNFLALFLVALFRVETVQLRYSPGLTSLPIVPRVRPATNDWQSASSDTLPSTAMKLLGWW
jgi:hypothetical protein